jgi:hypothetical protein
LTHYNITVYSSTRSKNSSLVILVIVIDDGNSLVLFGGLHFPVLLGTSRLLGGWAGIFAIVTVTWLLSVIIGALVFKVVLIFVVLVVFGILGLGGLLCLLLRG